MTDAEVLIVGAGALGAATAWQLTELGCEDVLVVDRGQACSGTSPQGAGLVNRLLWHPEDIALVEASITAFKELDERAGGRFSYHETGGLLITGPEDDQAMDRSLRIWRAQGLDVSEVAPGELSSIPGCEHLQARESERCVVTERDGWAVTTDAVNAMLDQATARGAELWTRQPIAKVEPGRVELADGGQLTADRILVACGVWTPDLLADLAAPLPLQAYRAQATAFEHGAGEIHGPCVHDCVHHTYWRPEGPSKVVAGNGTDLSNQDLDAPPRADAGLSEHLAARLAHRWPTIAKAKPVRAWAGYEAGTPDARPLVGPLPGLEGVHVCAGGNGFGFMRSPALGEIAAHLLLDRDPPHPAHNLDPGRFEGLQEPFEVREGFALG